MLKLLRPRETFEGSRRPLSPTVYTLFNPVSCPNIGVHLTEGDCFYQPASGIELDIWCAVDTVHRGYFVFWEQQEEASFWTSLEERSRDGAICDVSEHARPAQACACALHTVTGCRVPYSECGKSLLDSPSIRGPTITFIETSQHFGETP